MNKSVFAAAALAAVAALPRVTAAQPRVVDVRRNVNLISSLGDKCLDVEGEGRSNGTRIIGYTCNGRYNQEFWFHQDGRITHGNKCLVVQNGQGREGDQIVLWDCNGGDNEKWQMSDGRLIGQKGLCLDLQGGLGGSVARFITRTNQPAIL